MRHLLSVLTIGIACSFTAGMAQAQTLGASFETVRHTYSQAKSVDVAGSRALELRDVDYAGVRWTNVDFIFDPSGHLQRMAMTTTAAPYETVMHLAETQLSAPTTSAGLVASADDADSEMQMRVCQRDDGQVTLTYEPLATLS